jgi:hypothetical protein
MRFTAYSDTEWQRIKEIVARVGLDADTVRVGVSNTLLREALEGLAVSLLLARTIAGWQRTSRREVKATVTAIKNVQQRLNIFSSPIGNLAPVEAVAASKALEKFVAALAQRPDSDPHLNASKSQRRAYLLELEKIWRALPCGSARKLKAEFLLACAEPSFGINGVAVRHFLERVVTPNER